MAKSKPYQRKAKKTPLDISRFVKKYRFGIILFSAWFVLIASFLLLKGYEYQIMDKWLASFCAQAYVLPANEALSSTSGRTLPSEVWADIVLDDAVAVAEATQSRGVTIAGKTVLILGSSLSSTVHCYPWLSSPENIPSSGSSSPEPAYASLEFARQFNLNKGQAIYLPTPGGPRQLVIVGIFAQHLHPKSTLVIDRSIFSNWFKETSADYLAINLKKPLNSSFVYERWQNSYPGISVLSRSEFHALLTQRARPFLSMVYTIQIIAAAGLIAMTLGTSILAKRRSE